MRNCLYKSYFFCSFTLFSAPILFAASADEEKKEPIWVMSWAMFIFFIGMMIAILSHSRDRMETRLTGEDKKQNEEELAMKIEEQRREEKKRRSMERRRQEE